MRLEVESPRRVAVVESTGEVLVLTKDEVRRYSRHGSQVSRFCSTPSQPSDMLLLKNGQVSPRRKIVGNKRDLNGCDLKAFKICYFSVSKKNSFHS